MEGWTTIWQEQFDAIAEMRRQGLSVIEAIKAVRIRFSIKPARQKDAVEKRTLRGFLLTLALDLNQAIRLNQCDPTLQIAGVPVSFRRPPAR